MCENERAVRMSVYMPYNIMYSYVMFGVGVMNGLFCVR